MADKENIRLKKSNKTTLHLVLNAFNKAKTSKASPPFKGLCGWHNSRNTKSLFQKSNCTSAILVNKRERKFNNKLLYLLQMQKNRVKLGEEVCFWVQFRTTPRLTALWNSNFSWSKFHRAYESIIIITAYWFICARGREGKGRYVFQK